MNSYNSQYLYSIFLLLVSLTACSPEQIVIANNEVEKHDWTYAMNNVGGQYHYIFLGYSSRREFYVEDVVGIHTGMLPRRQFTTAWVERGGYVTFDGEELMLLGSDSYSYDGDLTNLSLTGSYQSFTVTDNYNFPDDTLIALALAPVDTVFIISPANTDTLTKSNGITIRWTPASGNQDVRIMISGSYDSPVGLHVETNDDGSYTFPSAQTSKLGIGQHDISIMRGHYNTGTAPDNQKWLASLFTKYSVSVHIQ